MIFDIGRGASQLVEIPRIFLTHGHLDHSSGIAYHISQRSLRNLPGCTVYTPESLVEPLNQILQLWSGIEGFPFNYEIIGIQPGEQIQLQGNYSVQAFPAVHRVESLGYVIQEKRKRLKKEFQSLSGAEIADLKKKDPNIFYEVEVPLIAFSGDTTIEFVLNHPHVQQSKILFLECTYIDEKRPVERARKWGHTHLDEIAQNAEAFRELKRLFLIHFSPRYRKKEVFDALKTKLPDWLYKKTIPYSFSD